MGYGQALNKKAVSHIGGGRCVTDPSAGIIRIRLNGRVYVPLSALLVQAPVSDVQHRASVFALQG